MLIYGGMQIWKVETQSSSVLTTATLELRADVVDNEALRLTNTDLFNVCLQHDLAHVKICFAIITDICLHTKCNSTGNLS